MWSEKDLKKVNMEMLSVSGSRRVAECRDFDLNCRHVDGDKSTGSHNSSHSSGFSRASDIIQATTAEQVPEGAPTYVQVLPVS